MPSLADVSPPPAAAANHHRPSHLFIILATSITASLIILLSTIFLLHRKLSRNRTAPSENPQNLPRRLSYSLLHRATAAFSPSNRLGHGGVGSVYKAVLPSGLSVAVKIMNSPVSIQAEREFHNELSIAAALRNPNFVSLLGYSSDRRRRRLILVYELMPNRSLQDALFDRKCPELLLWRKRFEISLRVASALQFLHHFCNPPVIHGDVKPSNILLDSDFVAKIGDFGLARLKFEDDSGGFGDNGSILEETESVLNSGFVENMATDGCMVTVLDSPETVAIPRMDKVSLLEENFDRISENVAMDSCVVTVLDSHETMAIPGTDKASLLEGNFDRIGENVAMDSCVVTVLDSHETMATPGTDKASLLEGNFDRIIENVAMESCVVTVLDSPETVAIPGTDKASSCGGNFDRISVESGKERKKCGSGRDWWWKQETAIDGSESGRVKDYEMEWIGNEIEEDRPKTQISIDSSSGKMKQKKKRRLEWWASCDERGMRKNKKKPREWWKEEFCDELARKKKKKKKKKKKTKELGSSSCRELWWQRDEDSTKKRKKKINKNSKGSIDWWLDGLSGRRNSLDGATSEIPKSGGISSTPSMRGTVCYIAPEYSGGGQISEKCDVYSFGVLLLVLVSGRRPLQVTASPISEFERANLTLWARQLARSGKLLDLVDPSIHSLDKEQALLCITIALLCLQKSPSHRPTMKEIVAVLSGEAEPPHLPFEFSPSPPSNFIFKSQKATSRAIEITDATGLSGTFRHKTRSLDRAISFVFQGIYPHAVNRTFAGYDFQLPLVSSISN